MVDADDPRPDPTTGPPAGEPSAPPPAGSPPPPKKGWSTGAKVAVGCGALAMLALVILIVAIVAGGLFIKDKAGDMVGGLEAQAEATERVRALEAEHPFVIPPDGVVGEERAQRFVDVTDDAWADVGDLVDEMVERGEEIEARGETAGLGDIGMGLRGLGGARLALADALEEHEMSVGEYLWTGMILQRAYGFLEAPDQVGVPPENLAVADAHRETLAEIFDGDGEEGRPDKGFIFGIAWTMGAGEGVVREGLGLDTLMMGN